MATTDTDTNNTTNKTPLALNTTAHPMCIRLAKGCPTMHGGRGYHSMVWPVEDVGGDGEALWRVAFWWPLALSVASVMGGVKSSNTHTPPGRSWVG